MKLQRSETCLFGVALLLLTQCTLVSAGMACYQACLYACLEVGVWAFANPLGIAVGITGCNTVCMVACACALFIPPACFANDTTVAVSAPDGTLHSTPVSAVHAGDQVLTLVDGRPIVTRVVRNVQSKGSFDFFEFEVRSDHTVSTLKVTPQHAMLILDASRELRFFVPADVRVGDEMLSSDGSTWNVSGIRRSTGAEKFTLVTSEGSVLASGVLVSTICDEEISSGLKMDDVVEGWKLKHSYDRYAHSQLSIST
jgi:hypothetical protein